MAFTDTVGNFLNDNSGAIGNLFASGAQMYGQQNAGEAISKASTAGIGVAGTAMGDVGGYWSQQQKLGANADTALSSSLGIGGAAPDYSNFMNMPGYKFAVQQGTQTAERQAAAMGNAGNSGTAAMIGNQVTGTAMQDYNNYIGQLYQAAGLGSTANTAMTGARMQTAGNVEQLGMNSGMAQAGMYAGMGQTASGAGYGGNYMGPNGSGVGGAGGIGGLIGSGLKAIGGWLGSGNNSGGGSGTVGDMTGGVYNGGAFGGGAPYYDPSTGGYPSNPSTWTGGGNDPSNGGMFDFSSSLGGGGNP
jgi:hypothetical protein